MFLVKKVRRVKDTFTFAGINSIAFSVHYLPSASNIFGEAIERDTYDEEIAWRNGGVYYGSRVKKKTISLSCYFEDISERTLASLNRWLYQEKEAELIFDEMPWKYYTVRVSKIGDPKAYRSASVGAPSIYSGTFSIEFTAYQPFAKMAYKSYDLIDLDGASIYTGIVETSMMPESPTIDSRRFLVYNCGTERVATRICIGGESGKPVLIRNETNGDKCKVITLPPDPAYLDIDGERGRVDIVNPSTADKILSYESHDEGYITLEPCGNILDENLISYTAGSNVAQLVGMQANKSLVEKYGWIDGKWHRIAAVTDEGIILDAKMENTGDENVRFVAMNIISIETEAQLTRLEIDYTPMVR